MKLILASSSPRRREILSLLGAPFDAIEPEFDERITAHRSIEQEVLDFAVGKARSVARTPSRKHHYWQRHDDFSGRSENWQT